MGRGVKAASSGFVVLGFLGGPVIFFGLGSFLNWLLP